VNPVDAIIAWLNKQKELVVVDLGIYRWRPRFYFGNFFLFFLFLYFYFYYFFFFNSKIFP
jgi:hypothetical protein